MHVNHKTERALLEEKKRLWHRIAELEKMSEELLRREAELRRQNRSLRVLSECNQWIMRAEEESELLQKVCEILVQIGGYRLAWIGFAEHDRRKSVRPVAQAGYEEGYLESLGITWSEKKKGQGPTGTAIRSGKPVACQNILTDPRFSPWRQEALKRGYSSSIAIPIRLDGSIIGTVNIYASEPDAFDNQELGLLEKLGEDLSYGLQIFRMRKRWEETRAALKTSEKRFREVVQDQTELICRFKPDGTFTFVNESYCRKFGHSAQELLGHSFVPMMTPSERRSFHARMKEFSRENPVLQYETRTRLPDGNSFWAAWSQRAIFDPEGNIVEFQVVGRDISEQKQTRQELERQLQRTRMILETTMDGYILGDPQGKIMDVNQSYCEMIGYSREELLGMDIRQLEVIIPSNEESRRIDQIMAKKWDRFETRHRRKDGRILDLDVSIRIIEFEGTPMVAAFVRDITATKAAMLALQDSMEKYSAIFQNTNDAFFLHELTPPGLPGKILEVNPMASKILGYSREELLNMEVGEIVSPEDFDRTGQLMKKILTQGRYPFEIQVLSREGERIPVEITTAGFTLQGRRMMLSVMRDLREQKEAEAELRESEQRYRYLFENAPIALWEEDFSELWQYLQGLQARGVQNLQRYFQDHPEELEKGVAMVRVLDVNRAALQLYKAQDKRELLENLNKILTPESLQVFQDELLAIMAGKREYESKAIVRTLDGEPRHIWIRMAISGDGTRHALISTQDISELVLAQEELAESENKFRSLTEESLVGVYIIQDGIFAYVNPKLAEIFGYSVEDLLHTRGPQNLVYQEDWPTVKENLRKRLTGEVKSIHYEFRGLRKDGQVINIEVFGSAIQYGGRPAVIGTLLDITMRKRNEETLRRQMQELTMVHRLGTRIGASLVLDEVIRIAIQGIAESLHPDVILFFLREGEQLQLRSWKISQGQFEWGKARVHRVGECLCGLAVKEQASIFSDDIFQDRRCTLEECKRAGLRSFTAVPLFSQDQIIGVLGIAYVHTRELRQSRDFLETMAAEIGIGLQNALLYAQVKKHEAELEQRVQERTLDLKRSEEQAKAQYQGIPVPTTTWQKIDDDFILIDFNEAAEKITHGVVARYRGTKCTSLFKDRPEIPADISRCFRQKRPIAKEMAYSYFSSEEEKYLAVKYAYVPPDLVLVHTEDITDRKKAEQNLLHYAQQLEAANKELESFSYSISHDLRAPLRAIDGFSRILLEEYAPRLQEDARQYLRKVSANAQQMGQLIDDLLSFSRLSRTELRKVRVDLTKIVSSVITELQHEQQGRQVDFQIGELPACQGDPAMLKQIFMNLLSNSLKFTRIRERAVIEIGSRKERGETVYFVRDNGVGFDMRYVDKLFGVFQRLHRVEEYEGTGVGLAIVQRVIHRHGGRIWAEGEVDRGATFYFVI